MRYFFNCCFGLLLLCCNSVHAQNYPVYNSFYVNPFLYNPAEALTDYTQVYALYRQQWTNVEGAPTLAAVTITSMMNESRAGVGGKISSYKRGLLSTTDFSISYAYGIPMGQKNWLFLGLSGGGISNTIDLTKVADPSDPAIANYLANNFQPAAGFGFLYRAGSGLNVGVSLPQLFPPKFNADASFSSTTVSPSDNVFVSIYYKRKVESRIVSKGKGGLKRNVKTQEAIAPLEFYFNYKYSKFGNSQFEFLGKLNLSQHFWVGGSYRLPYGFTGNVGISTERFLIGYSYEPGNQPQDGFSQGSHEVILGLKLGKQKKFKRNAPVLRSTLTKSPTEKHTARFQETTEDPNAINQTTEVEAKKRYFVVIRVFADFTAADGYKRKLINDKFNAEIFYNPADKKYYVHVLETQKAAEAHEEVRNLKTYTKLKEARVMIVTTK
ncbi:PorP/SprF family type IX secretion system membrane protein [Chryseolinea lacunae]|uniref:PorP/SprF family type IX secretion system membrane protein n=1 Tax=Chryseolinea lacunae TaxID=2801331 RepID=A0ABS1L1U8_9BACT|nr:PorP/SprF family type IX secretion system membrane protein [Chryseolinea lacunae]MBL0745482.1 PorP/SprF family type IX secretion system membrane protein [Chryseolinea lacunae]